MYISSYRITPKEAPTQHTIHAEYSSSVEKVNGDKFGVYPKVVHSKYRVDAKRPMLKDGREKPPWTMDFQLKDLPVVQEVLRQIKEANMGFFDECNNKN